MSEVKIVGIDETSLRKGQNDITVVHDLQAKRLLFACEGRDHQTVVDFCAELKAYGGDPEQIQHVCQDMSAAFAKGVARGFRTAANFIVIAYLRMSKLKHLPSCPLQPATPKYNVLIHRCL
ncbi:putative transposase IS204/IS1001/IS1096/IS1165 family protein [Rhodoferax antarcticus ANT.BR]|uniref:Putative transposase IS204/IS1001/IS1096/IS1165 family protein n=1 Tax=Rhodoferax antarcticus ANT.BR TaxID=1111071 RepID=A0A1Q8YKE8_9BURK|nr:putative transposase IS204/IS1001/IS1096/IS1165 family protein [Rhodoferax antarcticus ANT.BR]